MQELLNKASSLENNFGFDFSIFSLPKVGIGDIIDILLVAYLIYIIIMWIKDTRAWVLFKGIIVILVMSLLAVIFQLNTIWWIFRTTIGVGITALIVVFQPELRRALEQLGRGNIIFNFFSSEMVKNESRKLTEQDVDEIIDAIKNMSKVKTGALIVFEQNVGLAEYERTGIPMDALISSQLLENIFEHNTPLHDGAVIIRNNRIVAATCFLPLSDDHSISKQLGTRHRAALGLSEVSDCKIIIISEERGTVSMAHNGKLYRNISEEFMRRHLIVEPKEKEGIKIPLWKGRKKHD